MRSSHPHRDHGACCDCKIKNCSVRIVIYCRTIIKDIKSQIFMDVAREGLNHDRSCVM
jgi:hypothetical protein